MEHVGRGDWKNEPMPSSVRKLSVNKSFTLEEMERIRRGLRPRDMEDKWFLFFEDDCLHMHRSWTGTCIYRARFESGVQGYTLVEADMNGDKASYNGQSDAYEVAMLGYLIDRLLLSKQVVIPSPDSINADELPMWKHNVVGYGRSSSES